MININLTKNKLTKRSLGLVIMVGFAFMGVIACSSGGGGSTPAGGGNGAPLRCTETDTSLDEVTSPTAAPIMTITNPSDASTVTLTWTEPTADGFTGVEITGGTPALASPIVVAKGTQTATIMGVAVGVETSYTIRSMYGTNCSEGIMADPPLTLPLPEVTGLTATLVETNDASSITLAWTQPTPPNFTGVEISGGTPALASPMMVAAGTQTATITARLTIGIESTYTVKSIYGENSSTGVTTNSVALPLPEVTGLTASALAMATDPNDAGSVTLTWTDPTADAFTGVEITGGTPALASPMMVAAGTQTATISGFTPATESTFTVKSIYGSNSSAGETASATTPNGVIALFTLGKQDGDFGFAACQNAIENTANSNLRSRGYTQARFFGSTSRTLQGTHVEVYAFKSIATDTDALGVTGTDISGYTMAAFTDLTGTTAPTTTFGAASVTHTLSSILTVSRSTSVAGGLDWSTAGRTVVETVTGAVTDSNRVWTFTGAVDGRIGVLSSNDCNNATSSMSGFGNAASDIINRNRSCSSTNHVVCVAR